MSWKPTASHCINAAVSSGVAFTVRDVGFTAGVFNLATSSVNSFGSDAPRLCTLESIRGQWVLINGYNNVALRHYHANDVWMLLISSNRSGRPEVSGLCVSCSVSVACLSGRLCASITRRQRNTLRSGRAGRPHIRGPLKRQLIDFWTATTGNIPPWAIQKVNQRSKQPRVAFVCLYIRHKKVSSERFQA